MTDEHRCDRMTCKGCIQITSGMRGYFAVHMTPDTELGFCEPWQTGPGSYKSKIGAVPEAKSWAESEGLPFMG